MKTTIIFSRITQRQNPPQRPNRLHHSFRRHFLPLWILPLLVLPALAQAQFNYITNNGSITITRYNGVNLDVTIPSTINGLPVTSIGDGAFDSRGVTSVTIPNSSPTSETRRSITAAI